MQATHVRMCLPIIGPSVWFVMKYFLTLWIIKRETWLCPRRLTIRNWNTRTQSGKRFIHKRFLDLNFWDNN